MSECRKLFQKNRCELFAFPTRQSSLEALSCGELFFCSFFQSTGVVLCFFPLIDGPLPLKKQSNVAMSIFKGRNYPDFNDPFTAFLSSKNISFLIFEEGSINTNIDNSCMLSGVEFSILKHRHGRPTLLCKKTEDIKIVGSHLLVKEANFFHQTNEKYIFINCLSSAEGFNIYLRFPILTEQVVKEKILYAQSLRSLNTTCLNSDTENIHELVILHATTCLFFLPTEIFLNLPFHGFKGGKVYFSYKEEDKSLQVTIWSDFFELGDNPTCVYARASSHWQINNPENLFTKLIIPTKIFILQDPNLKLVQIGNFQYLLKNAKMQFVFKDRSLGLFFMKTKEQKQSFQSEETGPSPSSMQSSTSQTSTCTTDIQIEPPQRSINMPYTQSSPHPQLSLSQTLSCITDTQPQGSMGILCAQTDTQAENPPHASMQIPPFYTKGLPMQGALDSSQLALEDVNQISTETWEQLNVILKDVSTDTLLTLEEDARLTLEIDNLLTFEADDFLTLEADDLLTFEADDLLTIKTDDLLTIKTDDLLTIKTDDLLTIKTDDFLTS